MGCGRVGVGVEGGEVGVGHAQCRCRGRRGAGAVVGGPRGSSASTGGRQCAGRWRGVCHKSR
eukprot:3974839-Prymnesium_polylepis.2